MPKCRRVAKCNSEHLCMLRRLSIPLLRGGQNCLQALLARQNSSLAAQYDVEYRYRPPSPPTRRSVPCSTLHCCAPSLYALPGALSTCLGCRSPTEQVWPASKQQKKCESLWTHADVCNVYRMMCLANDNACRPRYCGLQLRLVFTALSARSCSSTRRTERHCCSSMGSQCSMCAMEAGRGC